MLPRWATTATGVHVSSMAMLDSGGISDDSHSMESPSDGSMVRVTSTRRGKFVGLCTLSWRRAVFVSGTSSKVTTDLTENGASMTSVGSRAADCLRASRTRVGVIIICGLVSDGRGRVKQNWMIINGSDSPGSRSFGRNIQPRSQLS